MQLYETFTACSTHLRNWSVAICKAQLSNKMASYTTDQRIFIKTCHPSGGSHDKKSLCMNMLLSEINITLHASINFIFWVETFETGLF